jgi:hypothetical protein
MSEGGHDLVRNPSMLPSELLAGVDVIREGWLYVSRKQKIKWDRRYFILRKKSTVLQYSKTPKVVHLVHQLIPFSNLQYKRTPKLAQWACF